MAVTRAWVSPRVKRAEPWVRGRTPTSHAIARTSSNRRPSSRWPFSKISRLSSFSPQPVVDGGERGLLLRLVLGDRRDVRVLHLLHLGVGLDLALGPRGRQERLGQGALDLRHEPRGRPPSSRRGASALPTRARRSFCMRDDLLDDVVALDEGLRHHVLRHLVGARLDHDDRVLGAGHQQVQLALRLEVGGGGVDDEGAVPVADAHRAHRPVERDVGDHERGRGADDGERVRVVLQVGGEQQADDLRFARVALGEERPQRAVDHPGGQDLLLVRAGPRA